MNVLLIVLAFGLMNLLLEGASYYFWRTLGSCSPKFDWTKVWEHSFYMSSGFVMGLILLAVLVQYRGY